MTSKTVERLDVLERPSTEAEPRVITREDLQTLSEGLVHDVEADGQLRLEVIKRLLGEQDPAVVRTIEQQLAQNLEAAKGLQDQFLKALNALEAPDQPPAANEPPAVQVAANKPPTKLPASPVDGVKPPESVTAAGDDEEDIEEAAAAVVLAANEAPEAVVDPYADRNAASQALLDKLIQPDLSIPGYSDLDLLKNVRELLIRHSTEPLAIRIDFDGNMIIGTPEPNGNGLRTRLMTLHHEANQGTVDWLRRSMRSELTVLDRYQITVIEDPVLQQSPINDYI